MAFFLVLQENYIVCNEFIGLTNLGLSTLSTIWSSYKNLYLILKTNWYTYIILRESSEFHLIENEASKYPDHSAICNRKCNQLYYLGT